MITITTIYHAFSVQSWPPTERFTMKGSGIAQITTFNPYKIPNEAIQQAKELECWKVK